jgi:drug/metabolite transporter (DMT)-like permease
MDNDQNTRLRQLGLLQVALAGFSFGFLGIFGKLAFASGLKLGELLAYRFVLAALILAAGLACLSRRRLFASRRDIAISAGLGLLGYAVFSTLYFKAIEGVSVALASLLLYTYPAMVALGARVFLKEPLARPQWLALFAALIGLGLLLYGDTQIHSYSAVACGLLAAASYSAYILISSRLQSSVDSLTSGFYVMTFAAIGLFVFHRPSTSLLFELDLRQALILVGIAVICTVGPLVLFLSGLQKLGNTEASLLSTLEPVTAALAGAIVFGERMSALQLCGGFLVLAALIVTALARPKTKVAIQEEMPAALPSKLTRNSRK